ncbi:phosphoribosyltransferase domain-containing protein [Rhodoblastus acidophilus]|uniref:phosphoribosyltransferase domain-containing protein n=1 Tax=Rhodoblastus acidophilus TaxID=1074 RepID=UPI000B50C348|nr:phosphoribosyltransferase domain-containing protein [Rhodoblastus acidophilus]PPQ34832.1 phosphoribosyltransferase [Rhodoblastus acidophilus]RAI16606.1 phosphoribosyltransferase [Rhodoblastus acidophilus]
MTDLPAGRIHTRIENSIFAPEFLFGVAQRRNPKRSFLFVSRVLGRHIPVAPSVMRETYRTLANMIPGDLLGPVLVVGMAETAIGLGAGIHDSYVTASGRDDAVFLATTRCDLGTPLLTRFSEDHSHATSHLIHRPSSGQISDLVQNARTLILVDDEITTGRTIANLHSALIDAGLARVERVVLATLTDWSNGDAARSLSENSTNVSLLSGRYNWTPHPAALIPEMPHVDVTGRSPHAPSVQRDWGRLGVRTHVVPRVATTTAGEKILVLGSGEYVWPPFLLAEALEAAGARVKFSSITRSPIATGHAIETAFAFKDNYGLGIANFLYNVDPGSYDRIILCVETPSGAIDPALIRGLGPKTEIRANGDLA